MQQPPLYDDTLSSNVIFQGDIFPEIDFFERNSLVVIEEGPSQLHLGKKMFAIISHTCSINKSNSILVSPIITLDEYREQNSEEKNFLHNLNLIKQRKGIYDKFYLDRLLIPSGNDKIPLDCMLDLKVVNIIKKDLICKEETAEKDEKTTIIQLNRITSLSNWGRHLLNFHLAWLYGRPIVDWSEPWDGTS